MKAKGRLLAVDPGKVRVGLAVCDPDRIIASPLSIYTRRDRAQDACFFLALVKEEEICQVVVGLPVHMSGQEGTQAELARQFGQWLSEISGIACVYWDERFTSKEAESRLWQAGLTHKKRKERRDAWAAQIMLQSYLDAGCPMEGSFGALEG